jgi:hypothetical protein
VFKAKECGLHKQCQGYAQRKISDVTIKCKLLQQGAICFQEHENSDKHNEETGTKDRRKLTGNPGIPAVSEGT